MRILTIILLLAATYIAGNLLLLPANKVHEQSPAEIINDEEYTNEQLIYNKNTLLVRKKREMTSLKIAILSKVLSYVCINVIKHAINATPFKPYMQSRLQYWGFGKEGEGLYWKNLAIVVNKNVHLDEEGFIHKEKGIGCFMNAPAELISKIQEFREEAAGIIAKKLEDEKTEEARMLKEKQKSQAIVIHNDSLSLSERVKIPEDLDQMSKAIMADSMIDTLISIDGMGETTWKYNPNNKEHRTLYEGLLKVKNALEAKYMNKCKLKKVAAAELPAYKPLFERILGLMPTWVNSLFKKFNDIPEAERKVEHNVLNVEVKVVNNDLDKTITDIHAMFQQVLLRIKKDAEAARENAKQREKGTDQAKVNIILDVGAKKAKQVRNQGSAQGSLS